MDWEGVKKTCLIITVLNINFLLFIAVLALLTTVK